MKPTKARSQRRPQPDRSFEAACRALESRSLFSRDRRTPSAALRTARALRSLCLDQSSPDRSLVVAGTNGKGSTCAFVEALLQSAGVSTGLFTSPHLVSPCERIRVRGRDVSPEVFAESYFAIERHARGLTHFEVLTLMAAWIFEKEQVDFKIWEVGLGGTHDATNAIPHRYCAIARLGLDHQEILGKTLPEIAANKFGIVQNRFQQVVHLPLPPETLSLAQAIQKKTHTRWTEASVFQHSTETIGARPQTSIHTPWGRAPIGLLGPRGAQNASLALSLFESMGFDPARSLDALARIRWPGRMERLNITGAPCPIYASGDHNAQGVMSLLEILPFLTRSHLHVLAAVGQARDPGDILGPFFELPNTSVYLTEIPFKGRKIDQYGTWASRARGAWSDPKLALERICSIARPGELILVTGSLYLVGAVSR